MTGGFLDSFSGALDGVTEADASSFDVQHHPRADRTSTIESASARLTTAVEVEASTPARGVPALVQEAAKALLAGSIFSVPDAPRPRNSLSLWLHTEEESQQILFGEPILLGRSAPVSNTNFLRVESDKVSREHCGVRVVDGMATCVDLGSTNGTWIDRDGSILEVHGDPLQLHAGDKICTMVNRIVLARITATSERP